MKKIAIITSTRAEYGLLSPVIRELRKSESDKLRVHLIVTGTHLSESYGMTVREIDERIDYYISVSVKSDSALCISENQAEILTKFTSLFLKETYDAVIILGDRYETLAIAIAAGNTRTPIFHLCGGDTTEGALDEWIRHSITKISYLHFVTNEESRRRVIQLGEDPNRVFNFGSTSIDNAISLANMKKKEVLADLGLSDCRYALCTYHPVTLEDEIVDNQINELFKVIKVFPEIEFIVTKSNADLGGERINHLLDENVGNIKNLHVFASLGVRRYLSLMKYAEFVLGNSSSGIIETPIFQVPTVNVGDRQRGRLYSDNIINCGSSFEEIKSAVFKAMSADHIEICKKVVCPYGNGHAAEHIAHKTIEVVMEGRIDLKKKFYDLNIFK